MSVPHIGIDILEPDRLMARLERSAGLKGSLFTPAEILYCEAQAAPYQHFAARFCAKEAVVKALGIDGWDPLDVEIRSGGAEAEVELHGPIAAVADALSVVVTISMSHLPHLATAVALARLRGPE